MNLTATVADLAERARLGDQNAMGMIVAVRESAKRGSVKAQQTMNALLGWLKANPGKRVDGISFGAEDKPALTTLIAAPHLAAPVVSALTSPDACLAAIVLLAAGPKLSNDVVRALSETLESSEERAAFHVGYERGHARGSPDPAERAGAVVRKARRVQEVRAEVPGSITRLNPVSGWELSEPRP